LNQNPEQLALDEIDRQLLACGWVIQTKKTFNLAAGPGVAIREFQTAIGPADYVLFVHGKCDKIEETINDSLKQTGVLRQSILNKAFEGKLNLYHSTNYNKNES
jgi:type I restriction enzyme R subunit